MFVHGTWHCIERTCLLTKFSCQFGQCLLYIYYRLASSNFYTHESRRSASTTCRVEELSETQIGRQIYFKPLQSGQRRVFRKWISNKCLNTLVKKTLRLIDRAFLTTSRLRYLESSALIPYAKSRYLNCKAPKHSESSDTLILTKGLSWLQGKCLFLFCD